MSNLIKIFEQEVPEQIKQIAMSLARQDAENAAITAHGLKGSAAIFGAARIRELTEIVEQTVDRGALDSACVDLEGLRAESERVWRTLEAENGRHGS